MSSIREMNGCSFPVTIFDLLDSPSENNILGIEKVARENNLVVRNITQNYTSPQCIHTLHTPVQGNLAMHAYYEIVSAKNKWRSTVLLLLLREINVKRGLHDVDGIVHTYILYMSNGTPKKMSIITASRRQADRVCYLLTRCYEGVLFAYEVLLYSVQYKKYK